MRQLVYAIAVGIGLTFATARPTSAQEADAADLAKQAQNPLSSLISLPFQNNTSFGIGPFDRTQNVLNIQPVVPVTVGSWNIINRPILPVIYQPDITAEEGGESGLGDLNYQLFFSPLGSSPVTWGIGPVILFPTGKDGLGSDKWAAGPAGVLVYIKDKWVFGGIIQNIWSFAGDSDAADVNQFLFQYFINYNLEKGVYLVTAPIITANWEAPDGDKWIVPVGGGVGKIFAVGSQKINGSVHAYYNVVKPETLDGPDWSLRLQLQFLFPK